MIEQNPDKRPHIDELIHSELMPSQMEDYHMNDLLKVVANPNTVFYKKIVDVIFEQSPAIHKDFSDWNLIYNSSHEFFINLIG
mmetsp:Transcript_12384/g.10672  ORF Transcript_12384/g.10672 Transcript_12384/m.10672 type:complete len:83 (-) Transcript_12384:228-476(-)